jgi:hypothetical protein
VRRRPGETPQKAGGRFEKLWASVLGVKPQKGSGNSWFAKLDVADGSITWSLKFTTKPSFTITKELLREAEQAIYTNGSNSLPGLAIAFDDGDEVVVVLKASDFVRILSTGAAKYIVPSKGEAKRQRSQIPALLRDNDSD